MANPIKDLFIKPIYRTLNRVMTRLRTVQSNRIPKVELAQRHIANLKIVLDRPAFLRALPSGGIVAEAGVDHGDFSAQILAINRPERLHLIDMWSSTRYHGGLEQVVRRKFEREIADGRVQIDLGRSTDVLMRFPDATFDWVYIDTDHGYTVTAQELELCRNKVKKGGIIAGHDYITGNWDGGVRYGVVEAVHEFCVKYEWELILLTHETDRHLSFAIRAIAS